MKEERGLILHNSESDDYTDAGTFKGENLGQDKKKMW